MAGTYTILSRAVDDSINLETPSAGRRSPSRADLHHAILGLGDACDRQHDRCERSRTRCEVSVLSGGHRRPASASTRAARTPVSIPARSGRAPARSWRPSPSRTRRRAAGRRATFSNPVTIHVGHHLHGILSHQCRALFQHGELLHRKRRQRSADRAGRQQRRLRLWQQQPVPDKYLPVNQLLGRRDVQSGGTGSTNQPPVAVNDVGPAVTRDTPVTITAASLLANDSDPNGDPLTITAVSAAPHGTVTLQCATQYAEQHHHLHARRWLYRSGELHLHDLGRARRYGIGQCQPCRVAAGIGPGQPVHRVQYAGADQSE